MNLKGIIAFIGVVFVSGSSWAEQPGPNTGLDSASQEALTKTQQLLNNPQERTEVMNQAPATAQLLQQVQNMTANSGTENDVFGLTSMIFDNLVKETAGDPQKMKEILERAKKDPQILLQRLTDEQKAKLKSIASKIEEKGIRKPASTPAKTP